MNRRNNKRHHWRYYINRYDKQLRLVTLTVLTALIIVLTYQWLVAMEEKEHSAPITPYVEEVAQAPPQEELDPYVVELLACAIYNEAGGDLCSDTARIAVGCVVLNRVRSDSFPGTIEGVLTQKGQYQGFENGVSWPARVNASGETHAVIRAYECAERVLRGEIPAVDGWSEDVIWQANFIQGDEIVAYLDGLYFCK